MIEIVPNWHPIWVHFTVGLLSMGTVFYLVGLMGRSSAWGNSILAAGRWNLIFGAMFGALAVWTGLMAAGSVAHDDLAHANMMVHKQWAYATLAIFVVAALWLLFRLKRAGSSAWIALLAVIGLGTLAVTGYEGGQNVFEHGLGVQRLPDVGGHDHDAHDHGEPGETGQQPGAHAHGESDAQDHGESAMPGPESAVHHEGDAHAHGDDVTDAQGEGHAAHEHGDAAAPASQGEQAAHDHGTHDHDDGASTAAPMQQIDTGGLADQAQALSSAIASGDEAAVRRLMAADVLIFEGGGAERSLEEYAGHHMGSDMAFIGAIDREVLERRVFESDSMGSVATRMRLSGSYKGKDIDMVSSETLVFERRDGVWKIIHIHWASGG